MAAVHKENGHHVVVDEPNKRIKVLGYEPDRIESLNAEIEQQARQLGITKLIIYAKKADVPAFLRLGYRQEGRIDGFFNGENAQMLARFLTMERATSVAPELAEEILRICQAKAGSRVMASPPPGFSLRPAGEEDADELARLYRMVFATYPTPMDNPGYIRQTMRKNTYYLVIETDERIVCAASAEVTPEFGSAELTDCATHPDYLGKGLLQPLFVGLEEKMRDNGVFYLYTLTRAQSHGMNVTAAKLGYHYRGRLVNNCTIYSGFEDMNIWVKPLKETWE